MKIKMRHLNLMVVLFLTFILLEGCKNNDVVLKPEIKKELIDFNEKVKNKIIKKYSVLSLNFYEYDNIEKVGITLSNRYSSNEIQGLFYLDNIPVLLNFENGSIDRDKLNLIIENPDYDMLKTNLKVFIESHEEKPQDSFDPPYVLFDIKGDKLVKVN